MVTDLLITSQWDEKVAKAVLGSVQAHHSLVSSVYTWVLERTQRASAAEQILALIQWTKKTRLTGAFSGPGKEALLAQIRPFIERNEPIEFLTFTSARNYKAWDDAENTWPDGMELATAIHIDGLDKAVRKIYEPGIRFTIVADDLTWNDLFPGHEAVIEANVPRLTALMTAVSDSISVLTEWWLFEAQWIDSGEHTRLVDELSVPFFEFLKESAGIPDDQKEHVSSFQGLREMWWTGIIPDKTREFYLKRIQRTHWQLSDDEQLQWLARFFATVMAKVRNRIGQVDDHDAIRCTFAAPVPGNPVAFNRPHFQSLVWSSNRTPFWVADWGVKYTPENGFFLDSFSDGWPEWATIIDADFTTPRGSARLHKMQVAI